MNSNIIIFPVYSPLRRKEVYGIVDVKALIEEMAWSQGGSKPFLGTMPKSSVSMGCPFKVIVVGKLQGVFKNCSVHK